MKEKRKEIESQKPLAKPWSCTKCEALNAPDDGECIYCDSEDTEWYGDEGQL